VLKNAILMIGQEKSEGCRHAYQNLPPMVIAR
jgi:hypothetical protein